MMISTVDFTNLLLSVQRIFAGMDPAYMDMCKMVFGISAWIGGLTLFMWNKERKRKKLEGAARLA